MIGTEAETEMTTAIETDVTGRTGGQTETAETEVSLQSVRREEVRRTSQHHAAPRTAHILTVSVGPNAAQPCSGDECEKAASAGIGDNMMKSLRPFFSVFADGPRGLGLASAPPGSKVSTL